MRQEHGCYGCEYLEHGVSSHPYCNAHDYNSTDLLENPLFERKDQLIRKGCAGKVFNPKNICLQCHDHIEFEYCNLVDHVEGVKHYYFCSINCEMVYLSARRKIK